MGSPFAARGATPERGKPAPNLTLPTEHLTLKHPFDHRGFGQWVFGGQILICNKKALEETSKAFDLFIFSFSFFFDSASGSPNFSFCWIKSISSGFLLLLVISVAHLLHQHILFKQRDCVLTGLRLAVFQIPFDRADAADIIGRKIKSSLFSSPFL